MRTTSWNECWKNWEYIFFCPACILMAWKYQEILEHYSKWYYTFSFSLWCVVFMFQRRRKKSSLFRLHIIKCEYLKRKTRDGEQTLKSSDLWMHWACIFIKLQKQMFSENFRLFIDFHLWSLSKSVWGAPTGLQGFDEGVMFQTWLHTVPCQLLGYDNR